MGAKFILKYLRWPVIVAIALFVGEPDLVDAVRELVLAYVDTLRMFTGG